MSTHRARPPVHGLLARYADGRIWDTSVDDPATPLDDELGDIYIEEYRRSAADPDSADPASRRVVLTIEHSARANHDGGTLQFERGTS